MGPLMHFLHRGSGAAHQVGDVQSDLVLAVDTARRDYETARAYFDTVSEPELVDQAIHMCAAAEKRLVYLLRKAREEGVSVLPPTRTA